jgi:hypothetical protein
VDRLQDGYTARRRDAAISRRIEFIRSLFSELGFQRQGLETRTLAFVGYMRMVHSADASMTVLSRLRWIMAEI